MSKEREVVERCNRCGGTKSGAKGDCPVCDRSGRPKTAYFETHEPPHCPSCNCGAVEPKQVLG